MEFTYFKNYCKITVSLIKGLHYEKEKEKKRQGFV